MYPWKHLVSAIVLGFSSLAFAADPQAGRTDINTAGAEALAEAMHGVGMKRAQAIVLYREQNGAFSSVDELVQVRGISAKTVERNRDRITTGSTATSE